MLSSCDANLIACRPLYSAAFHSLTCGTREAMYSTLQHCGVSVLETGVVLDHMSSFLSLSYSNRSSLHVSASERCDYRSRRGCYSHREAIINVKNYRQPRPRSTPLGSEPCYRADNMTEDWNCGKVVTRTLNSLPSPSSPSPLAFIFLSFLYISLLV